MTIKMKIRYDLGTTFYDMPEPFRNMYMTIPRGFIKFDMCVEMLKKEPYKARLHRDGEIWWLEFPTQEDYMAFIMKWS
jgi:hypothetical protein